jgi:hypothetical protein
VLWFMSCLFDKDLPSAQLASVPEPYSSENPPLSVRIVVFFVLLYFCCR